jgi:ATP-binding cassette subfamily B protein
MEFLLALISDLFSKLQSLLEDILGDLVSNSTSIRLMQHAGKLDLEQFEDSNFYDKLERARQQTSARTVLISQLLGQAQNMVSIFIISGVFITFYPWLILVLLISVVPSFLSEFYFSRQSYSLGKSWTPQRRELDYLRFIGASDDTAKEIKIFGLSQFIIDRFREVSTRYFNANKDLSVRRSAFGFLFSAVGSSGYYLAYIFLVKKAIEGSIGLGSLTFLIGSFRQMRGLIESVFSRFTSISQSALYLKDLFDFFELEPKIHSNIKPRNFPDFLVLGFEFKDVGFKYPNNDHWTLRNLSFTLKPGEKLALVGENGAGKTTLVKLLARLYDPEEGEILLEGHSLKEYDLEQLRLNIGVIFQDFVRYQLEVSENISVGKIEEREDFQRIQKSAQQSLAEPMIEALPQKYHQMLGRKFTQGIELSGGGWQKIALARAYMRDAPILILDEPTAALDAKAEYAAFERFVKLSLGKTAILISHRFSTVRFADRILVLENGKMLEMGTHEELLKKKGRYSELFHLQARGYQ